MLSALTLEFLGWNHLYMHSSVTGNPIKPITSGPWNVKSVVKVHEESRTIWFLAVGLIPGQDPYFEHFCRVSFDGSFRVLTEADATHEVELSPNLKYFVDRYSRVDLPWVTEVRCTRSGRKVRV